MHGLTTILAATFVGVVAAGAKVPWPSSNSTITSAVLKTPVAIAPTAVVDNTVYTTVTTCPVTVTSGTKVITSLTTSTITITSCKGGCPTRASVWAPVQPTGYPTGSGQAPPPSNGTTWHAPTGVAPTVIVAPPPSYTTTVVTALTTVCPSPTKITTNGQTYTVTASTTLTITNCPCTLTVPTASATAVPFVPAPPVIASAAPTSPAPPIISPLAASPNAPAVPGVPCPAGGFCPACPAVPVSAAPLVPVSAAPATTTVYVVAGMPVPQKTVTVTKTESFAYMPTGVAPSSKPTHSYPATFPIGPAPSGTGSHGTAPWGTGHAAPTAASSGFGADHHAHNALPWYGSTSIQPKAWPTNMV